MEDEVVLVIDDMESVRSELKKILKNLGYKYVLEADNGHDALAILEQHYSKGIEIELVFCDINMPKMDGIAFVQEAMSNDDFEDVNIIMVTTHSEADKILEAAEAGAKGYINKPFDQIIVQQRIKELIG